MKNYDRSVTKILEIGTLICVFGLILTVLFQILTRRFFVEQAPAWTEEASRFFFVYAISFAAGLAQKDDEFVSMDYVYRKMNAGARRIADLTINALSIVLFLVMAVYSVQFIWLGAVETSPSLGLPMAIAFASMLVMSGSLTYFLTVQLARKIRTFKG